MQQSLPRAHLVRWLVAMPAIVGACIVGVLEWTLLRSTFDRHGEAPVGSFGEALRDGDLDNAFLFIRSGQDPNAPVEFRDPILTGDREVMVSPMLIAVASNRDDTVMMLMSFGARLDAAGNRFAGCLANHLGHERIARLIATYGGAAAPDNVCPDAATDPAPPLIAFGSAAP
jgi:hypothetical protein